jgi:hypothetical protein
VGGASARRKVHSQWLASGGIGIGCSANNALISRRRLRVVKSRWPNSQTAFRKPGLKNGIQRREAYEDRNARISILARGFVPRPDTLQQTDQAPLSIKLLADGAGGPYVLTATEL